MEIKARAQDTGGALGLVVIEAAPHGYGPPLHVHRREDEAECVLEGQIRFRVGDDEVLAGPGSWVWQPRGARTPSESSPDEYDLEAAAALAERFGFEVVGPRSDDPRTRRDRTCP